MEREGREIVEEIDKCKLRARGAEASWNEWEKRIDGMRWKMEQRKRGRGVCAQSVRRRQLVYILGSTTTALVSSNPEVPGGSVVALDTRLGEQRGLGRSQGVRGGCNEVVWGMGWLGRLQREKSRGGVERNGPRASSVSSPGVEELLAACLLPSFAIVSFLSVLVHSSVPID